jgi:uncharacterized protein YxjI
MLYIKQKVFSWGDKFTVKDDMGTDRFSVKGEVFSWGKKLHVYDENGTEVVYIQQKVLSFLPKFFIFVDGQQVAEIVKKFTFLKQAYAVNGTSWTVEGDFWAHNYRIFDGEMPVCTITKTYFSWGDSYQLDIREAVNEKLALAVVLAIDAVLEMSRNNASSNSSTR